MIYNINVPTMNNVNLKSDFRLIFLQGFIEIKQTIPQFIKSKLLLCGHSILLYKINCMTQ